ncbi:MAG: hypothetical protein K0R29_2996 [Pseudobdellovibrio sp.]|nr:hypothetical protein [Pseudobdellovibrio sp.]
MKSKFSFLFSIALITTLMTFFQNCGRMNSTGQSYEASSEDQALAFGNPASTSTGLSYTLNMQDMKVRLADSTTAAPVYALNNQEIIELIESFKNGNTTDLQDFLDRLTTLIDEIRTSRTAPSTGGGSRPDLGGSEKVPPAFPAPAPAPAPLPPPKDPGGIRP